MLTNPTIQKNIRKTLRSALRKALASWRAPERMTIKSWAVKHRWLSPLEAARPGKYRLEITPYLEWANGPLDALDDPTVEEVVCQKSAQVAWTSGVLGNALGAWADVDPSPILVLFPKEGAATDYMSEKFEPMVEATKRLRDKIDLRSRKAGQRQLFKRFPGGFLKLVGSNSPASVKSLPTPRVAVEEPDDCNANLKSQGDSIKMAKERTKTYDLPRKKVIIGGTPTTAGLSAIEAEMDLSDKRVAMIPCHECGQEHTLSFDNFLCMEDEKQRHPIFGTKQPETAYYACPHCGCTWDDDQKNNNVKRGRWQATADFRGIAGFYMNELLSPFPGSRFQAMMAKWLTAQHEAESGDLGSLITFINSSMGLPFEYQGDGPEVEAISARALDYDEATVPDGGLVLTAGVDVQHDRLEVVIRAWGRGEESWLILYTRLHGKPLLIEDQVWQELDKVLFGVYQQVSGVPLRLSAVSVDSSDGTTSETVYKYIRSRQGRGIKHLMAIKGSSTDKPLFSKPGPVLNTNANNTKAAKYGLAVFIVGVSRAKDLLIGEQGRITLVGTGPGRMRTYKNVNPEYYEQLLAEIKAPRRSTNGQIIRVWQKKNGIRNEALDCEVYALHASRAVKVELMTAARWDALEADLKQATLFDSTPEIETEQNAERAQPFKPRAGFVTGWKK